MAVPRGTAAYKKKDGILTLTDDRKNVIWLPQSAPGGPPTVSLAMSKISNLQQTPDSAPKVMLKVFYKESEASDPVSYLFHFNSPENPRAEANAVRDLLSRLIAESRSSDPAVPRPNGGGGSGGSGSATLTFANTVNSKPTAARFFDDNQLKNDVALQGDLLKSDRYLHQLWKEGVAMKSDSMSTTTFNTQFWSTRVNLLRAHAIAKEQMRGPYNVLAQVKPVVEANVDPDQPSRLKLNVTQEQIQLIFDQHPLVKRIYNENVPPLEQTEFWERFFLSKLSKKLRGERASGNEKPDRVFDKYDEYDDITAFSSRLLSQHVPHIIDVEANEENQGGFRSGNRKDIEMRPRGRADVPIIQTLNSISEKLLVNVAPADTDLVNPAGLDEDTYSQLALRDLRGDTEEQRIILSIKEQNKFFSDQEDVHSATAAIFAKQNPATVLGELQEDMNCFRDDGSGGINLHALLGVDDDSDSEDEVDEAAHVGSHASREDAQKHVLDSMNQRRSQLYGHGTDESTPMGLSEDIAAECSLTHATTMEFLHQFWSAFLSGNPERAAELGYLAESLRRSKKRIDAVATKADQHREEVIAEKKKEIRKIYDRTKKKVNFDMDSISGGREGVEKLMESVVHALDKAIADYQRALAAEGIQVSTES